jgi:hypothetical protein
MQTVHEIVGLIVRDAERRALDGRIGVPLSISWDLVSALCRAYRKEAETPAAPASLPTLAENALRKALAEGRAADAVALHALVVDLRRSEVSHG